MVCKSFVKELFVFGHDVKTKIIENGYLVNSLAMTSIKASGRVRKTMMVFIAKFPYLNDVGPNGLSDSQNPRRSRKKLGLVVK